MTNATVNSLELNLDTGYLETASISLIREYLARKGYRSTLETFDEEYNKSENSLNSRSKLVEYLSIEKLYEKNKTLKTPFKTILELIISYHSVHFKKANSNQETNKEATNKTSYFQKEMGDKNTKLDKKSDLKVDDINEGVGYDENDKRIVGKHKKDVDKIDLDKLKLNKLQPAVEAKKNLVPEPKRQPTVFREPTLSVKPDSQYDEDFEEDPEPKKTESDHPEKCQKSRQDIKRELLNNVFETKIVTGQTKTTEQKPNPTKTLDSTPEDELKEFTLTPINYEIASSLRDLLFKNHSQTFPDEWKNQSFTFCDLARLKYGIVQKKGGPCGVLAAVQAYIIQELVFCNPNANQLDPNTIFNVNKRERSLGLARGLAKLLWKAGEENGEAILAVSTRKAHFAPVGKYKSDGYTETLNLLKFRNFKKLENYLCQNVTLFEAEGSRGVLLLLYSAIFSRTIEKIITDMDEKNNKLMGMHGYCTQEMVNLLIHGRAVSNVFNDSVFLDKLELRGPNKRNDIGLLSLFEHYKSCEVGSYYKTPKYPIWVVCSESHFSCVFAITLDILNDWRAESKFDLYYYDGLAKQDEQIKLTLTSKPLATEEPSMDDAFFKMLTKGKGTEKDLTPPLELVLKTKWSDASVDWNNATRLL